MQFFDDLVARATYGPGNLEWLHLLTNEWQIIADAGYCDLMLWVPRYQADQPLNLGQPLPQQTSFVCLAQIRPTTTHTVFHQDWVGQDLPGPLQEEAISSWNKQTQAQIQDQENLTDISLDTELIPLIRNGRPLALLTVHREESKHRRRPKAERVHRDISHHLIQMAARGAWPDFSAPVGASNGNPRVSDGLIMLDTEGFVTYASPNALSIYKRINFKGELLGSCLLEATRPLIQAGEKADETLPLVLSGRMPWRSEIKARRASIAFRAIPLRQFSRWGEQRYGALLLCRDVTEMRRREMEMMSKDATIREIHHRVKNNLQTVSALLRLQSRRMESKEAREGLEQAMRRVSTIAMVHDALSQGLNQQVDFDDLIGRQFHLAAELASPGQHVSTQIEGSFGQLPSQVATPLALVINEVVANAVEHGLAGRTGQVLLACQHEQTPEGGRSMRVTISDDGAGISPQKIAELERGTGKTGLGTQIVKTLVSSELEGTIGWSARPEGGTQVTIQLPLSEG